MNKLLRDMYRARASATVAAAQSLLEVNHQGLKGQLREILITELMIPLLPSNAGTANGEIVDAFGRHSSETDLILYNTDSVPSMLNNSYSGIVPVDAAIFAIEIKSQVNMKELRYANNKAQILRNLRYSCQGSSPEAVIPVLFGFQSNLKTDRSSVLDQYKTILGDEEPRLRSICVVGKGHWFYSSDSKNGTETWSWKKVDPTDSYDEVLSFIATKLNVYQSVVESRGQASLSDYIEDVFPAFLI